MSSRTIRLNELVQREISSILRQRYQSESVALTVTEVRVAPDLRDARVFVSVVGGPEVAEDKMRWLRRQARAIREEVAKRIVIKYLPKFEYVLDESSVKSLNVMRLLDELPPPAAAE